MGKECNHSNCREICHVKKKEKKVYSLKRTPIKSPKKPIRPVAVKRASERKIYLTESKPNYLKEHPKCELHAAIFKYKENGGEAVWWPKCTVEAVEIHHAEGCENHLLNKVESFKAACSSRYNKKSCHCWVTQFSKEAIEIGISISKHANKE